MLQCNKEKGAMKNDISIKIGDTYIGFHFHSVGFSILSPLCHTIQTNTW